MSTVMFQGFFLLVLVCSPQYCFSSLQENHQCKIGEECSVPIPIKREVETVHRRVEAVYPVDGENVFHSPDTASDTSGDKTQHNSVANEHTKLEEALVEAIVDRIKSGSASTTTQLISGMLLLLSEACVKACQKDGRQDCAILCHSHVTVGEERVIKIDTEKVRVVFESRDMFGNFSNNHPKIYNFFYFFYVVILTPVKIVFTLVWFVVRLVLKIVKLVFLILFCNPLMVQAKDTIVGMIYGDSVSLYEAIKGIFRGGWTGIRESVPYVVRSVRDFFVQL